MAFKLFMMLMAVAVPLMMTVVGRVFMKRPPKTINPIFGYRTTRSMKNEDTWAFAHTYCGHLWFVCGMIFSALTLVLLVASFGRDETSFGVLAAALGILCVVGMVWSMGLTEKALKEAFDENGERRMLVPAETSVESIEAPSEEPTADAERDVDAEEFFVEEDVPSPAVAPSDLTEEDDIFSE